jgi:hypothetical protein
MVYSVLLSSSIYLNMIEEKSDAGIDLTAVEGKSIVENLHRVPALQLYWSKPGLALLHNYQSSYESQHTLLLQSRSGSSTRTIGQSVTLLGREQKVWGPQ